jgi:glutamine cyclotransferase
LIEPARVLERFPHDPGAFTQGLLWHRGRLFESTGLVGQSSVREVRLEDGAVLRTRALPPPLFGEGLAAVGDGIVSLTWYNGIGLRWGSEGLELKGCFANPREAWGLTGDGTDLIMSDGSAVLRFFDPAGFELRRELIVRSEGRPLAGLNELQWVEGEILANIWPEPLIARIDPVSGTVTRWIDVEPLLAECGSEDPERVANGIAWDEAGGRLFVTGKNWPWLYRIAL